MTDSDFIPGDPATHVIGKTEKPAPIHAPLPPKPPRKPKITARSIAYSIELRLDELRPVAREFAILEAVAKALKEDK